MKIKSYHTAAKLPANDVGGRLLVYFLRTGCKIFMLSRTGPADDGGSWAVPHKCTVNRFPYSKKLPLLVREIGTISVKYF